MTCKNNLRQGHHYGKKDLRIYEKGFNEERLECSV